MAEEAEPPEGHESGKKTFKKSSENRLPRRPTEERRRPRFLYVRLAVFYTSAETED